ncbi:MAG: hypothetical protein O3B09_04325 [Proteobacteria bacterium]|nr:hypothetical protein [Pseudomonadota bacterium]
MDRQFSIKKSLAFLIKPEFLVVLGIIFTVTSALISNYLLEKNSLRLKEINEKSVVIEHKINNHWKYIEASERKIDLAIIALAKSDDVENNSEVENYFSDWIGNIISSTNLGLENELLLLQKSDEMKKISKYIAMVKIFKERSIDKINDLYIERLLVENQKSDILEKDMFLKNMSLFLQIIGLILVLSRNIFSH